MDLMSIFSGANNWLNQNPEQFAIMADMLGQGFDKTNPFAGIGTAFGQSSLANKQLEKERSDREGMMKLFSQFMGGGGVESPTALPGPVQPEAKTETPLYRELLNQTEGMTPTGMDGSDGFSMKMDKDGKYKITSSKILDPKKKESSALSLADYLNP